jgi:putative transposase
LIQFQVEFLSAKEPYVKTSKFSEVQIVAILNEVAAGAKVGETCRKHGISEACYYQWKSKYGGMGVSQLAQLRELQAENARLKKMYAELALVHTAFQDAVAKKL